MNYLFSYPQPTGGSDISTICYHTSWRPTSGNTVLAVHSRSNGFRNYYRTRPDGPLKIGLTTRSNLLRSLFDINSPGLPGFTSYQAPALQSVAIYRIGPDHWEIVVTKKPSVIWVNIALQLQLALTAKVGGFSAVNRVGSTEFMAAVTPTSDWTPGSICAPEDIGHHLAAQA